MEERYYLVRVEETLSRTYKVKANSEEEAEEKMNLAYRDLGTVVLGADDFVCGDIYVNNVYGEDLNDYQELK